MITRQASDRGEPGVLLDLDPPALIVGQVPVEYIDLVERKNVEVLYR